MQDFWGKTDQFGILVKLPEYAPAEERPALAQVAPGRSGLVSQAAQHGSLESAARPASAGRAATGGVLACGPAAVFNFGKLSPGLLWAGRADQVHIPAASDQSQEFVGNKSFGEFWERGNNQADSILMGLEVVFNSA